MILASNAAGSIFHTFVLETAVNPVGGPNAPDYSASLSTSAVSVVHGNTGSVTITVTDLNGYTGQVNLGATSPAPLNFTGPRNSTLPGIGTFKTLNVTLTAPGCTIVAGNNQCTATLVIPTSATTPTGTYTAYIQMTGFFGKTPSGPYVQHTAILSITVT